MIGQRYIEIRYINIFPSDLHSKGSEIYLGICIVGMRLKQTQFKKLILPHICLKCPTILLECGKRVACATKYSPAERHYLLGIQRSALEVTGY